MMHNWLKRVIVGIGVAAFVCAATLPHHHETSSVSHQAAACRLCKIEQGWSAAPTPSIALSVPPTVTSGVASWRTVVLARQPLLASASPRSPPVLS